MIYAWIAKFEVNILHFVARKIWKSLAHEILFKDAIFIDDIAEGPR